MSINDRVVAFLVAPGTDLVYTLPVITEESPADDIEVFKTLVKIGTTQLGKSWNFEIEYVRRQGPPFNAFEARTILETLLQHGDSVPDFEVSGETFDMMVEYIEKNISNYKPLILCEGIEFKVNKIIELHAPQVYERLKPETIVILTDALIDGLVGRSMNRNGPEKLKSLITNFKLYVPGAKRKIKKYITLSSQVDRRKALLECLELLSAH